MRSYYGQFIGFDSGEGKQAKAGGLEQMTDGPNGNTSATPIEIVIVIEVVFVAFVVCVVLVPPPVGGGAGAVVST